ncbi:MAG: hypothetical protein DRJ96_05850 [Thermoprotei archaeon]|nr:MAG: hypothetical protein DRJ67_02590 [Thermoprotei archaeon]RLE96695.1 MAG: hypothetical protein DRJ96_05850 [Thermoprotei archaeon]RLE98927.1 MAG: hypothetical protein DRJ57_03105 [Thermoprotei archaeon]
MAWGWGGGRRGWIGPWPGRGPFSHLPPWLRPGWLFGRGACWWLFGYPGWAWRGYWGWWPAYWRLPYPMLTPPAYYAWPWYYAPWYYTPWYW